MYIAMTETEKFKALVLIDYWQEQFPIAFPKKPAPKVPLRIGIGREGGTLYYASVAVGATLNDINNALYLWCRGKRYWQSFKTNKFRFGATGYAVQEITREEAAFAKFKLRNWIYEDGDDNECD